MQNMADRILTSSIEVTLARLNRACMRMREHVYVRDCVGAIKLLWCPPVCVFISQSRCACVGAKADRMSVCLCMHPSIWLSLHMYIDVCMFLSASFECPSVHLSDRLYDCLCYSMYVHPSVLLFDILHESMNVLF